MKKLCTLLKLLFAILAIISIRQGVSACVQCPPGSYSNLTLCGTKDNSTCEAGSCIDVSLCTSCVPGYYNEKYGEVACAACVTGKNQSLSNQTHCGDCPKGTYGNDTGMAECYLCEPGMFNNATMQTTCHECSRGEFQRMEGQPLCNPCSNGFVCNETGCTVCSICKEGSASSNHLVCNPCMPGTSTGGEPGKDECSECGPGTYCDGIGCTECKLCEPGSYTRYPFSKGCRQCGTGQYQPDSGKVSCEDCQPGTYQTGRGQSKCIQCPAGYFCQDVRLDPSGCPVNAVCPPGVTMYQLCQPLFLPNNETLSYKCVPDKILYVIVTISLFIVILVAASLTFAISCRIYKVKVLKGEENKSLLPSMRRPVRNPDYQGL